MEISVVCLLRSTLLCSGVRMRNTGLSEVLNVDVEARYVGFGLENLGL